MTTENALTLTDNRGAGIAADSWIVTGRLFDNDEDMDGSMIRQHFSSISEATAFIQSVLYAPAMYK